jgi:hypothetical protein
VRRPFQDEATSLLDLFDLSFTRYVTPLIVKITWVLALLLAAVWLVAIIVTLVADLIPKREVAQPVEAQPGRPRIEFRAPDFGAPDRGAPDRGAPDFGDRGESAVSDAALRVILLITQIVAVILFLLWVRVALEAVIVIFHIAASVRSIDEKTPRETP